MGHLNPTITPDPVAASRRLLKLPRRPALALAGALTVLCLTAAACGGGSDGTARAGDSETAPTEAAPSGDALSTRTGAGIVAAGGNLGAVQGRNPCDQLDAASAEPTTIAYVGANLNELEAVGLEAIVVEDPSIIIAAYVNEVNFNGGIDGRCVELATYLWSLADPVSSFTHICTDMPARQPVLYFTLTLLDVTLECATIGAEIPTIGLYSSTPESTFVRTTKWLFIDDGAVEQLLIRSLRAAGSAGVIDENDRIGLLQGTGASAGMGVMDIEERIRRVGTDHVATANIPSEYGDLQLLLSEKRVRLLETGLSANEREEAQGNLAALPPELAELFAQIEEFYTEAATRFEDAGVTAVIATSDWSDVRRMMRAAEGIDWVPTWIANDIQPSTIVIADAPRRQAQKLVQVSARRAAGDEVPELDQRCITLRNTTSEAPPFAHRPHSDAWNLITSICDYLDVAFSALTRVNGPITNDSVVQALNDTNYDTAYGGLITFSPADRSGAKRFRVLQPDVDCVLNSWGCMRSTTDWLTPPAR